MSEAAKELSLIRKYLLGELRGEEREQLEERVLLDSEFRDKVLMVEENLIEDYTDGALEEEERQGFETMFYASPQRRLEVEVVDSLKQHAAAKWWTRLSEAVPVFLNSRKARDERQAAGVHAPAAEADLSAIAVPHGWRWDFRKAAVAVVLLVAVTVTFLIIHRFLRREPPPESIAQQQSRHNVVQREMARLNNPTSSQSSLLPVAATLPPGLSRGDEPPTTTTVEFPIVTLARGTESFRLRLLLQRSAQEYQNFQAELVRIGTPESYKVDLKPVEVSGSARVLLLTLPAHVLDDGDYRVQLSGHTANGRTEVLPDHYYYFRLARQ